MENGNSLMSSGNFVLAKSHLIISPFFSLTEFPWAKDQPDEIVFFFFNTEMLYDANFNYLLSSLSIYHLQMLDFMRQVYFLIRECSYGRVKFAAQTHASPSLNFKGTVSGHLRGTPIRRKCFKINVNKN